MVAEAEFAGSGGRGLFCASILAIVANIKIYATRSSSVPVEVAIPTPWPEYFSQEGWAPSAAGNTLTLTYSGNPSAGNLLSPGSDWNGAGEQDLQDFNAAYYYGNMMDTEDSNDLHPDRTDASGVSMLLDLAVFSSRRYAQVLLTDAEPVNLLDSSSEDMWNKYPIESHTKSMLSCDRRNSAPDAAKQTQGSDFERAIELSNVSITPDIFNVNSGYTSIDSSGEDDDTPLLGSSPARMLHAHSSHANGTATTTTAMSSVKAFLGYLWYDSQSTPALLPSSAPEAGLLDAGRAAHCHADMR